MAMIMNQITLLFLLRASLGISILGFIIRSIVFNRSKLWQKYEAPVLEFLIKNSLTHHVLAFCNKATFAFFTPKYQYVTTTVIIMSSFCMGVGLPLRLFILQGYIVPYQETLFLLLAVNAVFRSVIGLGMILRNGGLWRLILEQMGRSASRNSTRILSAIQNTPSGSNGNSENSGNNDNDHENSQKSKSEQQNNDAYIKWGTVFGGVAATGTVVGLYFTISDRHNSSIEASKRAAEASDRATEASNRATESNKELMESISRVVKEIAESKRNTPPEKD